MSTRANIRFEDEYGSMHVDRSHDGYPDIILSDIKETIDLCKGRWSGSELGQLVSAFIGMHFDPTTRIQQYEPCIGFKIAGDEEYRYWVKWNKEKGEYEYGVASILDKDFEFR